MMFSENGVWFDTVGTTPHPENEKVYGSFKEYWYQISRGKLRVGGEVVNPDENEDGVPDWLTADYNREEYMFNLPYETLALEAIGKARDNGWLEAGYDKLVIVFAQNGIEGTNLFTYADPNENYIQISERGSFELYHHGNYTFTHMGVYAHEFGHNLGFYDEYHENHPNAELLADLGDDGSTDVYNFDLMGWGIYNGPERKGECPATLSPYYRISKGWISSISLQHDSTNFDVPYSNSNPNVYRIDPIDATEDEHYLIETKRREGYDLYIPGPPADTVNQPGRLVIWHHNVKSPVPAGYTDRMRIKNADNTRTWESQLTDFFPSTFTPGIQDLNDISIPGATLGHLIVIPPYTFGNERPAHFALNGIQKLANDDSRIGEIRLNHAIAKNENSGSWQLVSVPVGFTDYTLSSIFPTAISAYKWQSGYVQVYTLENGPGYWANFPSQPQTLILAGTVIGNLEIPVTTGWNVSGTISDKVPLPNVCSDPPGIIENIYSYSSSSGYTLLTEDDSLKPGIGYWTKTTDSGTIILDRFAEPCELQKITSMPQIDLSQMDKFIIIDAEGNSQSLYVSNIDIDTTMVNVNLELPPFFSELNFDSRFEFNEFVKKVSADSGNIDLSILIHTNSYPISLAWELNPINGISYTFGGDTIPGKISNIVSSKGKISFDQLANNKIKLFAKAGNKNSFINLPKEFSLEQNYPNPFNPSTVIKFSVPEEILVNLSIYNLLGEKIKELKNEIMRPGYYEIKFDASNLASGLYLYKIESGEFTQIRKMLLLK